MLMEKVLSCSIQFIPNILFTVKRNGYKLTKKTRYTWLQKLLCFLSDILENDVLHTLEISLNLDRTILF